jgi:hypothetical protein
MLVRCCLLVVGIALWVPATARADAPPMFGREVVPVLYKLGCSSGACHGSFAGKGGLRLSLFAADPVADFREVRGGLARRINPQSPDESLLLAKPTGRLNHGGGMVLAKGSEEYKLIRRWIAAGAPFDPAAEGKTVSVRVEPATFATEIGAPPQPLRAVATLHDGSEVDVTRLTRFEVFDATIAEVDANGRVIGKRGGDTHILAHYAGQIGFTIALVPQKLPPGLKFPDEKLADPVDRLIADKLRKLNIVPSPICDDATFVRRAYLDTTGQLPTPEEVRKFLADTSPDKRAKLIDELLKHPLHSAVWATKLCDITGVDNRTMYDRVSCDFHDWYRNKLHANVPWDQIVYRIFSATTADGRSDEEIVAEQVRFQEDKKAGRERVEYPEVDPNKLWWQTGYGTRNTLDRFFYNIKFRVQAGPHKGTIDPQTIALYASSAFLGVRLECAECHKHPHDRWTQDDFKGFTASFAYVNNGVDPVLQQKQITYQGKPHRVIISGVHVSAKPLPLVADSPCSPRVLGGSPIELKPNQDVRLDVWKWMTSPENPYFAPAMVNRVWAHYFGRGLIDPVDALAAGNPPSHPEVMNELVRDFVASKYDLRRLHRRILNLAAYQRSWETNASNASDERNLSHRVLRRMTAEQALDAILQVTGTPLDLAWVYGNAGKGGDKNRKIERAVEFPLSRPGGGDSYVLKIFDKPQRTQSCDCERSSTPNLSQALYFYNDAALIAKIADKKGRLTKLLTEITDDGKLLDELYLLTLSRLPTASEKDQVAKYIKGSKSRTEAFEDLLWSLLNRREFLVSH